MNLSGNIRYTWTARSRRWRSIADWMNQVAWWIMGVQAVWPLVMERADGSIRIGMSHGSGSPFAHPWRMSLVGTSGNRKYMMRGGRIYTGSAWVDVPDVSAASLASSLKVWLRVKYYNDGAVPNEFAIESGSDWPEDDYETDDIPDGTDPASLPLAGWCLSHVRIAEYSVAEGVRQHLFSDVILPYGKTYTVARKITHQWKDDKLQDLAGVDTFVRGIFVAVAQPAWEDVFATGPCPEEP